MPALARSALWAAAYAVVLFYSRSLTVEGVGNSPPVSLIAPSAGVALVWFASARGWQQLATDVVLLLLVTDVVLMVTGAPAAQTGLALMSPLQYLLAIYLLRRWVPHLWGAGGRASVRRLSDFGWVLLAVALGTIGYGVVRTIVGEIVIPDETLSLAVGRATRSLAAMSTIGVVGILAMGWLAEARDGDLPSVRRPGAIETAHLAGASLASAAIFVLGFWQNPQVPSTFLLTLAVVWVAICFSPLVTGLFCLLLGGTGVWLTIVDIGPIAAVDDAVNRAAVAQMFVVVTLVLGLVISLSRAQVLDTVSDLERSRALNARRASELDLVMANLHDGVAIVDGTGRFVHANHALQTAFGTQAAAPLEQVRPQSEILGDERLYRASDGAPFDAETSPLAAALAGRTVPPEEWRPATDDGPVTWVTIAAVPLPPDEDHVPRAMVVMRDISAEKSHQDALATRAAELNLIIDKLKDGLAIVDEGGHYVQSNDALSTIMTGTYGADTSAGGMVAPSAPHLFHPDGRPLADDEHPYLRAIEGLEVHEEEYHLRRPGTPGQILHLSAYPLRVERGTARRAMVVVRDITAERSYEDSLSTFASTVAHDLNSPLSVIDGWAEALQDDLAGSADPGASGAAPMVRHIRGGVAQMRSFIADLLDHAVARDQLLRCERVPLRNMVKHIAISRDRPGLDNGGINPGDLPDVWADQMLVRQVFDNLIGNALKYVAPGVTPRVDVEAERAVEGWAQITVRDNGIGIDPVQRELIFDSFHRASHGAYAGTGLGLAICKRIVERHGGRIWVDPNPTGGSSFVFTLPTTPEAFASVMAN